MIMVRNNFVSMFIVLSNPDKMLMFMILKLNGQNVDDDNFEIK